MKKILTFIILMAVIIALLLFLNNLFPEAISGDQHRVALISSLIIITSMVARIATSNQPISILLKQIGGWFVIITLIISGYSYQLELKQFANRFTANLIPSYGQNGDGTVTFYASNNGHFMVTALLNDAERINFLLDTGASNVSLTLDIAESIGINTANLKYNYPLSTANGLVWGARITIAKMQIGPITLKNVEGTVTKEGLDTPLLGMSFLNRLKSFNIEGNRLTLVD